MDEFPESIVVALAEILGRARAFSTLSVTGDEVTVAGVLELSVTWNSKCQVPLVVRAAVETDRLVEAAQAKELPRLL